MTKAPHVRATLPSSWRPFELEPPPLSAAVDARVDSWTAVRDATGMPAFAAGCVATRIPGWVEDLRPSAEARVTALAATAASRLLRRATHVAAERDGLLSLRGPQGEASTVDGFARTFLGFDESRLYACVAVCASRYDRTGTGADANECARVMVGARLEGSRAPPGPSPILAGISTAVHHPRHTLLIVLGLVLLVAALAIVTRKRPRARLTH
jgi:hypothetical protein